MLGDVGQGHALPFSSAQAAGGVVRDSNLSAQATRAVVRDLVHLPLSVTNKACVAHPDVEICCA